MSPGAQAAGQKQLKMNPSPLLLAIPAAFDFTASSLMFIALTMTPASVYQMMRGFVTVITALTTSEAEAWRLFVIRKVKVSWPVKPRLGV